MSEPSPRRLAWRPEGPAWPSMGGALTASFLVHVLIVAALASIITRPVGTRAEAAGRIPIVAQLISVPREESDPPTEAPPVPEALSVPRPVPVTPSPPPSSAAARSVVPWAAVPVAIEPPRSLYSRPMVSEGVELLETRSVALLGERVERLILAGYAVEPTNPVRLKPAETIGYPIDALAAGIEGTVLVWFGVDADGYVVDKEVLDGPPELMAWVHERIERLVEMPAYDGQKAVPGWVALEIRFSRGAVDDAAARAAR